MKKCCPMPALGERTIRRSAFFSSTRKFRLLFLPFVFYLGAVLASAAQTLTTLASFNGANGSNPFLMSLVQGSDGSLYGTTEEGGTNNLGTVFKITPTGTLTTLYSFCMQSGCTDGENPYAGLVQATDGNFYGTTFNGGTHGAGVFFKITPTGTLTTLYSFCTQTSCADGGSVEGALVQGTDGNFYRTTAGGGMHDHGTVFKITSTGTLTTLYNFVRKTAARTAPPLRPD